MNKNEGNWLGVTLQNPNPNENQTNDIRIEMKSTL